MKIAGMWLAAMAMVGGICGAVLAESDRDATIRVVGRRMERLGRGVVAAPEEDGAVYVGWRLLATDAEGVAFHLYRRSGSREPVRLNDQPIIETTDFVDTGADLTEANAWFVRPILDGREGRPSEAFELAPKTPPGPCISIPLETPDGYRPNDASAGDLDGDGEYEIVLHQTGRGHDNAHRGFTDPPILQAYELDGRLLWQITLGRNIREGAHYTQFIVYDLDGDGRAEVACRTADGTVDAAGKVIGDPDADWRNDQGYILAGPEFLTVFDGETGRALSTVDYIPPRHPDTQQPTGDQIDALWGDDYGNRIDRFLACAAYLDGERPSLVMCRGYYTRTVLAAWDFRDGSLAHRWTFDSDDGAPGNAAYRGQGNHNLSVADVDGDGRDEIVYGACAIDDDGTGLYTTGLGHGDAMHLTDIDPARPGLEVWGIHERPRHPHAANLRDAATGQVLWSAPSPDVGRGLAADIDPRYPGHECWAAGGGLDALYSAAGERIGPRPRSCNMAIWWDGDDLRELLDGTRIDKWDWKQARPRRLLSAEDYDCTRINGSKSNPCLAADILGDWREEVLWPTRDGRELRLFTTTIPAGRRRVTLMHDPVYRLGIAWQNVAYNQPPHLGDGL